MIRWFADLPIERKLRAVALVPAIAVFAVAMIAHIAMNLLHLRNELVLSGARVARVNGAATIEALRLGDNGSALKAMNALRDEWLVSDAEESPHLNLGKVPGELYISCAEHDELAPLPMVEELRGLFARAGSPGEIELQPGVHHGFAFPQRWCYDKPAAERHWERLIALYRRRLG